MNRLFSIALITAKAARDLDEDLPALVEALKQDDIRFEVVDWDDTAVEWSRFDLALLRSTWDYSQRLPEFFDWVTRVSKQTRLLNPASVIGWNTDKHYLAELAAANVPVVASTFIEPDHAADGSLRRFLDSNESMEFVVKPTVGAGSRDAQRYGRDEIAAAQRHIQRLIDSQRSVLLQPYLNRVDEYGETALIFFDGAFSHAIRKGPLLRRGEEPTRALFAAEHIVPRTPSADEQELAAQTLKAMPFDRPLLYARVDLIQADDGSPRVLELELTEPSLFFDHAAGSAQRFARAIVKRARDRDREMA
ncbi:MAG: hypothetical protein WBV39_14605 [Rudaea sp.]